MSCRLAIASALFLLACSRPQHSPDYARAAALWTELVRARPGDAAEDVRAGEVLRLLEAVPADSLDATAAADLRQRIEADRSASSAERARRSSLVASAEAMRSPPAASAPAGAATVAPGQAPTPITVGMSLDDFRSAHGACFHRGGDAQVAAEDGGGRPGEVWLMNDEGACRERYTHLVGQAILFVGGSAVGVAPAASALLATARREPAPAEVRRTVELAQLPDGGVGMVVDGGVVPLPPGARVVAADGGTGR